MPATHCKPTVRTRHYTHTTVLSSCTQHRGAHGGAQALTLAPRAASASSSAPVALDTLTATRLLLTNALSLLAITMQPAIAQRKILRGHKIGLFVCQWH